MLTRSELTRNRVAMTVEDGSGRHAIVAERRRGGLVHMACSCAESAAEGWCRHQLDLLCLRYDAVVEKDDEAEFHFEDIVLGTPLADTADEVDLALSTYREALAAVAKRPVHDLSPETLGLVADHAADLAEAGRLLAAALGRLTRKLAAARALPDSG
jgi:hypothetical protein